MAQNDPLETELARAKALSPEARTRLADALRANIEAEAASSVRGGLAAAGFSRGILFSKSSDLARVREVVLPELMKMDDARFEQFAKRLASLREIQSPAPGSQ